MHLKHLKQYVCFSDVTKKEATISSPQYIIYLSYSNKLH